MNLTRISFIALIFFISFNINLYNTKEISVPGYCDILYLIKAIHKCYYADVSITDKSTSISFTQGMSFQNLQTAMDNMIKVTQNASLSYQQIRTTKFFQELKQQTYQLNYLTEYNYHLNYTPSVSPIGSFLSHEGAEIMEKYPQKFYTMCGNQLLEKVFVSNYLIINVTFRTNSYDEYLRINKSSAIKFLGLKETISDLTREALKVNAKGAIQFNILQIGGSYDNLNAFYKRMDQTEGIYQEDCELGNLEACMSLVDKLIAYAESFFKQIDANPYKINNDNSFPISMNDPMYFGIIIDDPIIKKSELINLFIINTFNREALYYRQMLMDIIKIQNGRPKAFRQQAAIDLATKYLVITNKNLALFEEYSDTYKFILKCTDDLALCKDARFIVESNFVKLFRDGFPEEFKSITVNYWHDSEYNPPDSITENNALRDFFF